LKEESRSSQWYRHEEFYLRGGVISYSKSVVEPGDQVFFRNVSRFFGGFAGLRISVDDHLNEFVS
jgi:hypothetical protein